MGNRVLSTTIFLRVWKTTRFERSDTLQSDTLQSSQEDTAKRALVILSRALRRLLWGPFPLFVHIYEAFERAPSAVRGSSRWSRARANTSDDGGARKYMRPVRLRVHTRCYARVPKAGCQGRTRSCERATAGHRTRRAEVTRGVHAAVVRYTGFVRGTELRRQVPAGGAHQPRPGPIHFSVLAMSGSIAAAPAIMLALLVIAACRVAAALPPGPAKAVYDQRQTGDLNVQLELKNLQVVALVNSELLDDYTVNPFA